MTEQPGGGRTYLELNKDFPMLGSDITHTLDLFFEAIEAIRERVGMTENEMMWYLDHWFGGDFGDSYQNWINDGTTNTHMKERTTDGQ